MIFGSKERYVVHTLGDEVLRKKAAPIPAVTPEIRALADRMIRTMRVFDGIGLAAPQIGESLQLVVIEIPPDAMEGNPTPGEALLYPKMPLTLINPRILERSAELAARDEGCLSLPDIFAPVIRPARVVLDTDLITGEHVTLECGGLLGRCIQHELDHLDGVVFSDRVDGKSLPVILPELRRLEKYGARHHYLRVITR